MKEFSTKNNFCVFLTQADDLGRVVIPKEIRRTMKIREGDPSLPTFIRFDRFYYSPNVIGKTNEI